MTRTLIPILSRRQAAEMFLHLRLQRGWTRIGLAHRLGISKHTLVKRERHEIGLSTEGLIDTAARFGYRVALVPQRHPGARPTGTGWPA